MKQVLKRSAAHLSLYLSYVFFLIFLSMFVSISFSVSGFSSEKIRTTQSSTQPSSQSSHQYSDPKSDQFKESNVILLMLDGVRWQEVFHGTDPELEKNKTIRNIFPNLFHQLKEGGFIIGDMKKGEDIRVANSLLLSLPAYQSILTGSTSTCFSNYCGRVSEETFAERVKRELKISRTKVATIASWSKISHAVEHREGATFVNAGLTPLQDEDDDENEGHLGILEESSDPHVQKINQQQHQNPPPWKDARFDRYTFAHALHFLKKHQPRFLFISLNDSDEWAHKGHYRNYIKSLRQYDQWIAELIQTLKQMGDYGVNTTLIITTDHGRGKGDLWSEHNIFLPESKNIWLFGLHLGGMNWVDHHDTLALLEGRPLEAKLELKSRQLGPAASPSTQSTASYTHLDIRPTVEMLLGLRSSPCKKCVKLISDIFGSHKWGWKEDALAEGR